MNKFNIIFLVGPKIIKCTLHKNINDLRSARLGFTLFPNALLKPQNGHKRIKTRVDGCTHIYSLISESVVKEL